MSTYQPKILKRTEFGNPVLTRTAKRLTPAEIVSEEIKQLIADMRLTLEKKRYGVGLAAPQVGKSLALSVIGIKATPSRPNLESFEQVIINPTYEGIGRRSSMWEGCISLAGANNTIFAKALRYKTIKASWLDENGKKHQQILTGFVAHVFQHETDHLNGILFPTRVRDHTTWMNASEYRKRIASKSKK